MVKCTFGAWFYFNPLQGGSPFAMVKCTFGAWLCINTFYLYCSNYYFCTNGAIHPSEGATPLETQFPTYIVL
jgi:hypothetical protein